MRPIELPLEHLHLAPEFAGRHLGAERGVAGRPQVDPQLLREGREALDALTTILQLGSVYPFQR